MRGTIETKPDGSVAYVALCAVIGCKDKRTPTSSLCETHWKEWKEYEKNNPQLAKRPLLAALMFLKDAEAEIKLSSPKKEEWL